MGRHFCFEILIIIHYKVFINVFNFGLLPSSRWMKPVFYVTKINTSLKQGLLLLF